MMFPRTHLSAWPGQYRHLRALIAADYPDDIEWSQSVTFPESPTEFALEFTWVVINSGMKWKVAYGIFHDRVRPALIERGIIGDAEFAHPGKQAAINRIWRERARLFEQFKTAYASGPEVALAFCVGLPWIGDVTKFHLAKNFGVDCAKPDRHLERVAEAAGTDTHTLCAAISRAHGDRVATVDYVIWRACEMGVL